MMFGVFFPRARIESGWCSSCWAFYSRPKTERRWCSWCWAFTSLDPKRKAADDHNAGPHPSRPRTETPVRPMKPRNLLEPLTGPWMFGIPPHWTNWWGFWPYAYHMILSGSFLIEVWVVEALQVPHADLDSHIYLMIHLIFRRLICIIGRHHGGLAGDPKFSQELAKMLSKPSVAKALTSSLVSIPSSDSAHTPTSKHILRLSGS